MEFKCQSVALNQIDISNTFYRISTRDVLAKLVPSIKAQGVINPPVLLPDGKQFTIVTGFARVNAARQVGLKETRCLLVTPDAGLEQCARIATIDNAMQRELCLMEQANAIGILSQVCTDDGKLVQTARECGLSVNRDMAHKLLKVSLMPSALQQGLSDGTIALPIALHLSEMDEKIQSDALAQLLIELKIGLNRQRELIDWVVAIARRDGTLITDVLQSGNLRQLRMDSEMDMRQKGQAIRQMIKKMRYPAITHHEAHYAQTVKALKLKKGTQLSAPTHFEGQMYSLKFDFKSFEDLLNKQEEFTRLIKSQTIKDLWNDDSA